VFVLEQATDFLRAHGVGVGDAVGICTDQNGAWAGGMARRVLGGGMWLGAGLWWCPINRLQFGVWMGAVRVFAYVGLCRVV
jgi:hypothetical protein